MEITGLTVPQFKRLLNAAATEGGEEPTTVLKAMEFNLADRPDGKGKEIQEEVMRVFTDPENTVFTKEQQVNLAKSFLRDSDYRGFRFGDASQSVRNDIIKVVLSDASAQSPKAAESLGSVIVSLPNGCRHDFTTKVLGALQDKSENNLFEKDKAEIIYMLSSLNNKNFGRREQRYWSGEGTAESMLTIAFSTISEGKDEASEVFEKCIENASPENRKSFIKAAINLINHNDSPLTKEQKTNLAETMAGKSLTFTEASQLLRTNYVPKDTAIALLKKCCSACYNEGAKVSVSKATIENIVKDYIEMSPQLDEAERKDILQGSLLLLIQRAEKAGVTPDAILPQAILKEGKYWHKTSQG